MSTKEANYADETVRETQHAKLDEVYSKRRPTQGDVEIDSVEVTDGKSKPKLITLEGDVLKTTGNVQLDRDGWLSLAKHASRRAQAV
jgi:hypothetical protein